MKKLFENWRKYISEDLAPGSYPLDGGGGQSGIPDDKGGGGSGGGQNPAEPEKETAADDPNSRKRVALEKIATVYVSLQVLTVTGESGNHLHLRQDSNGKILETAMDWAYRYALRLGYTDREIQSTIKEELLRSAAPQKWYKFSADEIDYFAEKWDDYGRDVAKRKYTNIEAYINSGMPEQESRPGQFGASIRDMRSYIRNASWFIRTLGETGAYPGWQKYAIGGEKSLFRPVSASKKYFPGAHEPVGVGFANPEKRR
jgi:hypothetical protein